jgi:hypothetical protein
MYVGCDRELRASEKSGRRDDRRTKADISGFWKRADEVILREIR